MAALLLLACNALTSETAITVEPAASRVARGVIGTQTALAPTVTLSPTITLPSTATFTQTPTPSSTPRPPTATLDAEGVERMLLCFKAAVIVHADMEAYFAIMGSSGSYSDALNRELSNL